MCPRLLEHPVYRYWISYKNYFDCQPHKAVILLYALIYCLWFRIYIDMLLLYWGGVA